MRTTMSPIQSAIDEVPRQPLRCIGNFKTLHGYADFPISWEDWDRDSAWAAQFLKSRRIGSGDFVALVSTGHEAPWYGPVMDALNRIGATICPLEPARFESMRAKMFFTRFPITSVIGLDQELCGAIEQSMGLKNAMTNLRTIVVRPNALQLVADAGFKAEVILPLGPALGLPCSEAAAFHLNEAEWNFTPRTDALVIETKAQRALDGDPIRLPSIVEKIDDHTCSCVYGHTAIRLK
jgi:hypothetical protein